MSELAENQEKKPRLQDVDFFRFVAVIAVVIIHAKPFMGLAEESHGVYPYVYILFDQMSRFAVPFFFVVSGYFWGLSVGKSNKPVDKAFKSANRILMILAFWSLIYIFSPDFGCLYEKGLQCLSLDFRADLTALIETPLEVFIKVMTSHLWFLWSLASAMLITGVLVRLKMKKTLLILSIGLYAIGVLAMAYTNTPIGFSMGFNTRNGPFFALFPFVLGYFLSHRERHIGWMKHGALLFLAGMVVHFAEISLLYFRFETWPALDYVFSTWAMGYGLAMMALSGRINFVHTSLGGIIHLGKQTLGIYAAHRLFVDAFRPMETIQPYWASAFAYIAAIMLATIVLVWIISRIPCLRRFVM